MSGAVERTPFERPPEPPPDEFSGPPPGAPDPLLRFDLNKLPVDTTKTPINARIDTAPAATCPGLSTCIAGGGRRYTQVSARATKMHSSTRLVLKEEHTSNQGKTHEIVGDFVRCASSMPMTSRLNKSK